MTLKDGIYHVFIGGLMMSEWLLVRRVWPTSRLRDTWKIEQSGGAKGIFLEGIVNSESTDTHFKYPNPN